MRQSQRALLLALGSIVFVMLASAVSMRFSATRLSGQITTRTYDLRDFDGLALDGVWEANLVRGEAWRVEVGAPAELAEHVEVKVVDGSLTVGLPRLGRRGDSGRADALTIGVTMPQLARVAVSGASTVDLSGFDGESLEISISGAAEVEGHASRFDRLQVSVSGAADADLDDVTATDADVTVSGAAHVRLRMAGGKLTGRLSGPAQLDYYGTVSEQSVSSSAVSDIRHLD